MYASCYIYFPAEKGQVLLINNQLQLQPIHSTDIRALPIGGVCTEFDYAEHRPLVFGNFLV